MSVAQWFSGLTCAMLLTLTQQGTTPVQVNQEPVFLAPEGPTSGPFADQGRPWLAWDSTGQAMLVYVQSAGEGFEVRARRFGMGEGWQADEPVLAGLKQAPWMWAAWLEGQGPALMSCHHDCETGAHTHPVRLGKDDWASTPTVVAPEDTYATDTVIPSGEDPFVDHYTRTEV